MKDAPLRVLVVGQTPPPFGGQAIAIQALLDGEYERISLSHIRMRFSRETDEIGHLGWRKVLQLPALVLRILWARLTRRSQVLYYPPSGSGYVPFVRDVVILLSCKWAFRWTVFHFHAAGLVDFYEQLGRPMQSLFRAAYFRPDVAIVLSGHSLYLGFFGARHEVIVPDGVPDDASGPLTGPASPLPEPVLLFVGVIRESKGVPELVDACAKLRSDGIGFELRLMGNCQPPGFEAILRRRIDSLGLTDRVRLLGRRVGDDKWREFREADVFCFPPSLEEFGLAAVEAMAFGLPVVATRCPGLETIVADGESGFLVEVGDTNALAERIAELLASPAKRRSMGAVGRQRYLERFTVDHYRRGVEDAISLVVRS